jgi:(2Fe-2S) ferredoxin
MAQRKRYLFVCVNRRPDGTPKGSCAARGGEGIHARLKTLLKERRMADTEVRACTSSCLDVCWAGPAIAVEPDHFVYGRVQDSDVEAIVDALASDSRVDRLVLEPEDFVMPRELAEKPEKPEKSGR